MSKDYFTTLVNGKVVAKGKAVRHMKELIKVYDGLDLPIVDIDMEVFSHRKNAKGR